MSTVNYVPFEFLAIDYDGEVIDRRPHGARDAAEAEAQAAADEVCEDVHLLGYGPRAEVRGGLLSVTVYAVHGPLARYRITGGRVEVETLAVPAAEVEALRAELAAARAELARLRQPQQ
jgi:hypothetical protein